MADIWVQFPHCGAVNHYKVIVPPDGVDGADAPSMHPADQVSYG